MDQEFNKDANVTQEEVSVNNIEKEAVQATSSNLENTQTNKKQKKKWFMEKNPFSTPEKAMLKLKEVKEQQNKQKELRKIEPNAPNITYQQGSKKEETFVQPSPLFCPCGQKMEGPLTFYEHMKSQHSSESLEQIMKKQTVTNFLKKYPNNKNYEFEALESLENNNFQAQITVIASNYQPKDFKCKRQFQNPTLRGTYADLAYKYIQQFGRSEGQRLLLVQFFMCVKDFITRKFGETVWQQQSPKDILKLANHMYHYFRAALRLLGAEFGPISSKHLLKLLYLLGRWMFINKWTNDRLLKVELEEEGIQVSQVVYKVQECDLNQKEDGQKIEKVKIGAKPISKATK